MEDKREERLFFASLERKRCSLSVFRSNAAEKRKNLMKTIISMYWWRLLPYARHLSSRVLGGMRVKKSISECDMYS